MEDDLKKNESGRQNPFLFEKLEWRPWKESNAIYKKNEGQPRKKMKKMEDDHKKWKMT